MCSPFFSVWSLLCTILGFNLTRLAHAALVNVTIDDTYGDPTNEVHFSYNPPSAWSSQFDCDWCYAQPDANYTFMSTWHSGTYPSSPGSFEPTTAQVMFNGSALYVFCIIAKQADSFDANMELSFVLDDEVVGNFTTFPPNGTDQFSYNHLVYQNTSIPPGMHNFTLINGSPDGVQSLVLFDYIIYSHENDTSSPSTSLPQSTVTSYSTLWTSSPTTSSTSAASGLSPKARKITIVVSIVSGTIFIALLSVLFVLLRRKRQHTYVACSIGERSPERKRGPSPHIDVDEDADVSGWAEGTWDDHKSAVSSSAPLRRDWWSVFNRSRSPRSRRASIFEAPAPRSKTTEGSFILPALEKSAVQTHADFPVAPLSVIVVTPPPPPPPGLQTRQPLPSSPPDSLLTSQYQPPSKPEPALTATPSTPRETIRSPRRMPTSDSLFVETELLNDDGDENSSSPSAESNVVVTPDTPQLAALSNTFATGRGEGELESGTWGTLSDLISPRSKSLSAAAQVIEEARKRELPQIAATDRAVAVPSDVPSAEERVKMAARQEARFFTVRSATPPH